MNDNQNRMIDPANHIAMIHVESECVEHPVTKEILSRAPNIPVEIISEDNNGMETLGYYPKSLTAGKRHLLLSRNRGRFFSRVRPWA